MSTWGTEIIRRFVPEIRPIWAVLDPDGLVRNEEVASGLIAAGFQVVPHEDPMAFRYWYESDFRLQQEQGKAPQAVVVIQPDNRGFGAIAADILTLAERIEISVSDIFPKLNATVVRELGPLQWALLYDVRDTFGSHLSVQETEDLVLRSCFGIEPLVITKEVDLLRALIRLHSGQERLSDRLATRVSVVLGARKAFQSWPIKLLFSDSKLFWAFLLERWKAFIAMQTNSTAEMPPMEVVGPEELPFGHEDVRGYLEIVFRDHHLEPIDPPLTELKSSDAWWLVGVNWDEKAALPERIKADLLRLREQIPSETAPYRDWQRFSQLYGHLAFQVFGLNEDPAVYTAFWTELWPQVDERFVDWLKARFLGLINLPPSPPILVHHINRHLLRPVQEGGKVALLVLDGLSIAAWNVLRDHLSTVASAPYRYTESAVMAWTPSLTPVSRQAIFAGKAPTYFPETVFRTDRDGARWKEFWQSEAKLTDSQIEHVGFKGDVEECQPFEDDLRPEVRALGMTVFKTDQIMHGVNLGWPAMLGELSIWLAEGFLSRLLASLVARNFRVYVTSDHGNIEALGCGAISEGVLAERRGERTRIYTTPELRNKAAVTHAALGLEQGIDHLSGLYALMPLRRGAFVTKREKLVSHGGMSLDEMFVPFVEVTKL